MITRNNNNMNNNSNSNDNMRNHLSGAPRKRAGCYHGSWLVATGAITLMMLVANTYMYITVLAIKHLLVSL